MFLLSLKKNICCEYSLKYSVVIPISTHNIHFCGEIKNIWIYILSEPLYFTGKEPVQEKINS